MKMELEMLYKLSWTNICNEHHIGKYPYIRDVDKVTDNMLDAISVVINGMGNNSVVGITKKNYIMDIYDLVDRVTIIKEGMLNFPLADVSDKDLIAQIENRRISKGADGKWYKKKAVTTYTDEAVI